MSEYKPNLINAIQSQDRQAIKNSLTPFKNDFGAVKFDAVLSIPRSSRLPELIKSTPIEIAAAITVSLTNAFESMNLSRPMNVSQILDLTDAILESSLEDYLSLEDLILFLQGLVRGKYGAMYESMDIPKFMEKFEQYRIERHRAYESLKYEAHSNHKAMGDQNRTPAEDQLRTALDQFAGSIGGIKDLKRTA